MFLVVDAWPPHDDQSGGRGKRVTDRMANSISHRKVACTTSNKIVDGTATSDNTKRSAKDSRQQPKIHPQQSLVLPVV